MAAPPHSAPLSRPPFFLASSGSSDRSHCGRKCSGWRLVPPGGSCALVPLWGMGRRVGDLCPAGFATNCESQGEGEDTTQHGPSLPGCPDWPCRLTEVRVCRLVADLFLCGVRNTQFHQSCPGAAFSLRETNVERRGQCHFRAPWCQSLKLAAHMVRCLFCPVSSLALQRLMVESGRPERCHGGPGGGASG